MPRNGSGNMTPVGTYPPAPGSIISLADYKSLIDDIIAELTDSLSRSGKGGMSGPLTLPDGTVAAPSLAFGSEDNTGIFKPVALSELRAAIAGALVAKLTSTGLELPGALTVGGTATLGGLAGSVTDDVTLEVASDKVRVKDLAISGAKLADIAVTTSKLADGAVTRAKQAAVGHVVSGSCGGWATNSSTFDPVANLSVTLTTTGRPVRLALQHDGSGADSDITLGYGGGAAVLRFVRTTDGAATSLGASSFQNPGAAGAVPLRVPAGVLALLDAPPAGTHTYTVEARVQVNGPINVNYAKLVAYEL